MEFIGPEDYHFWQGVLKGRIGSINDFASHPLDICAFDNPVTRRCLDAYNWGICLGLTLNEQEYINLTTYQKPVIVVEDDIKGNTLAPITGNC